MKQVYSVNILMPGTKVFFLGNMAIWDGVVKAYAIIVLRAGDPIIRYDVEFVREDGDTVVMGKSPCDVFETRAELLASLADPVE